MSGPPDRREGRGTEQGPDPEQGRDPARPVFTPPRYAWVLALVVLGLVGLFSLTLMRHGPGKAARGLPAGATLPPFAAPLAKSALDGDVNLARRDDSGAAGSVAACSITSADVVTSCALVARRPLVLGFSTLSDRCLRQLDRLDALGRAEQGRLNVAAVAIRGDRERWRRLASTRWTMPVAYDRDGALAAAYRVELCPQAVFAQTGGRVVSTAIGELSDGDLAARVRELLAAGPDAGAGTIGER